MTPNPRSHPEGHSYDIPEYAEPAVSEQTWSECSAYLYGVDLFNHRYYWEAHEAWEGLWLASVKRSSEHMFVQGLIKTGAALLKVRMASLEIQDLIGARTLSKSGMDLLSRVGVSKFMGLDIVSYLESYSEFINPIYDNLIPDINQKTPRINLDF